MLDVGSGIVARDAEDRAVAEFLERASAGAAELIVEGEAGIGKTTLLWSAAEQARSRGFRVLRSQGAPAEVTYAYAAVADLLRGVDTELWADLPEVQRTALHRAIEGNPDSRGIASDERAVAAAFLAVVERIEVESPVLVVIDDAQWLDASSRVVIGFAIRRLNGRAGMVVAIRTEEPGSRDVLSLLRSSRPDVDTRIEMGALSLGALHAVVSQRLGRALPRPIITRIHEISGGNPFFAVELARGMGGDQADVLLDLPSGLAALVHRRIGQVDGDAAKLLLAMACATAPTVELVSLATGISATRVVELIESADDDGIVQFDGNAMRFAHPLFATGVYTEANPSRLRAMHRSLADVVKQPELKARHLALAATSDDPATVKALDSAATVTMANGAPAVAAELVELAIKRGGDTPQRRIRAAELHFRAGSFAHARTHLRLTIDKLPARSTSLCIALMLMGAVLGYGDSLKSAVEALSRAVDEADDNLPLRLQGLLLLTPTAALVGRIKESVQHAKTAVACADELGAAGLRSQALAMWATVSCMYGLGVDRYALQTALDLEEPDGAVAATFQASAAAAQIEGWCGNLEMARAGIQDMQRRFVERGTETDILWAAEQATMINIWLGRYEDATAIADDAVQRAEQLGGQHMLVTAWGRRSAVAAYIGQCDKARADAVAAISTAHAIGGEFLVIAPTTSLGFVEVSLGDYPAALAALEPILATFPIYGTEIVTAGYLPDAVEALTALGRVDEAERLVSALERNGAQYDRPWMLAVGARGRAHTLAARGELEAAQEAAEQAMDHHERLPMPFERARTQLLLGQIQRRRRHGRAAAATLDEALATFERLGAPLWARRTHAEQARVARPQGDGNRLTPTELRVAERAATGLSNKQIAAEMFMAEKTVERNLSRVYRKLGIRSRAALYVQLEGLRG
jgi:DNA-binding CsgD family transcriptional regulator